MQNDSQTKMDPKVKLPDTWSGELKALLALGIPMALTQLAQFVIMTIDVMMIGRLGAMELAAASLGTVVYFLLWMIGFGPVMAISPLVSQALGANQNDHQHVRHSVRMALWMIIIITPFMVGILLLTKPVAIFLNQDPQQAAKAGAYVIALAPGLPFVLATMALRNFLAVIDKIRVPLILAILTTALNAGLNYLLIYGKFGFPEWGLVGAGIASSISYIICFIAYVIYCGWDKDAKKFTIFTRVHIPDWARLKEVFTLGWPISLSTAFEGMLFNSCVLLMGLIGIIQVAAYQVALNVASLAFMLPWGISMAGAIRVGLAKGAQNADAVRRAGILTIVTSIIGIGLFAVPVALAPKFITSLYLDMGNADNTEMIALVVAFLPLAAAFMFFDAIQVACNQICRGLKDVNWPMIATGFSFWVIGFPVAAYLTLKTDIGANGVWYGLFLSLVSAAILLGARFYYLAWRQK